MVTVFLNIIPRNMETKMNDQEMRTEALKCAVHAFVHGKIDKEKIKPTADYFLAYIRDGK